MISFREAGEDDAELLTRLIRAAFADVAERFGLTVENCPSHPAFTTVDHQRQAIAKGIRYFVLQDGDGPAGCAAWDSRTPEEPWLARLSVLPGKRRRGYGQALVQHVVAAARGQALSRIFIGIIAAHRELVDWYERLGFEQVALRRYEHLPFEVLVMALRPG